MRKLLSTLCVFQFYTEYLTSFPLFLFEWYWAQGGYMSGAQNLILVGNPGLGKTHLAIGLALAACRQGKRVRFYKTATLINDLQVAQKKLTLSSFVARFVKLDLLVLDELGFIAVDKAGGQLLFQLV